MTNEISILFYYEIGKGKSWLLDKVASDGLRPREIVASIRLGRQRLLERKGTIQVRNWPYTNCFDLFISTC